MKLKQKNGKKIYIVGGGQIGQNLAKQLAHAGYEVTIIDQSEEVVNNLGNNIDAICFQGNGAAYGTLKEMNAGAADMFIAVTEFDELNILSCFTAHMLGAKHTIARIRESDYDSQKHFYKDKLGISMTINPELATAMEISRTLRFPLATRVETFANGRAELVEMTVKENWPLVDKSLLDLQPVMEWTTRISHIKTLETGREISYGGTYVTKEPRTIATLPVGYADGYPRCLSNKGRVLINGEFAPIVGRVCMDQFMVDVTHIDNVSDETEVILVGAQGDKVLSMEEVANAAHSFNYELPCRIAHRVPRTYYLDGKLIAVSETY